MKQFLTGISFILLTFSALTCGSPVGDLLVDAGHAMQDSGTAHAQEMGQLTWDSRSFECSPDLQTHQVGESPYAQYLIEWPGLDASKVVAGTGRVCSTKFEGGCAYGALVFIVLDDKVYVNASVSCGNNPDSTVSV